MLIYLKTPQPNLWKLSQQIFSRKFIEEKINWMDSTYPWLISKKKGSSKNKQHAMQQKQTTKQTQASSDSGSRSSLSSTIIGNPNSFLSSYMSRMSIILFSNFSIDHIWFPRLFLFTKIAGSDTNAPLWKYKLKFVFQWFDIYWFSVINNYKNNSHSQRDFAHIRITNK